MEVRYVQPDGELWLGHRAFHVRSSSSGHIVAATADGIVSIIGPDHCRVASFSIGRELRSMSLHPAGQILVATLDDGASLLDSTGRVWRTIAGPVVDAWFDDEGRLWTLARGGSAHDASLSVYDSADQVTPRVRVRLVDPFGNSGWSFPNSITSAPFPLWVATAEEGQAVYWLETVPRGVRANLHDDFEFCTPPRMSPAFNGFLLFAERNELRRYTFPGLELIASLDLPPGASGADVRYLSEDDALVTTEAGIVYLIGLRAMSILAEVRVAGHEPSHLAGIVVARNHLVSVHRELPDPELRQHSTLVRWSDARTYSGP